MRLWTWMLVGWLAIGLAGCGGGDGKSPVPDDVTADKPQIEMGTPDTGITTEDGAATTTDPNSEAPAFDPNSEAPAFDPNSEAPPFDAGDAAGSPAAGTSGGAADEER